MILERLNRSHLDNIVELAVENYKEESKVMAFPEIDNVDEVIYNKLLKLIDNELGVAFIDNGKVTGYITGIPINNMFGKVKGIFSPIHAHGAAKENRRYIYKRLYQKAAELWVSKGIFNHGIALYAQDEESINTFFWNGFGLRCVDAIRKVGEKNNIGTLESEFSEFKIRRIKKGEAEKIYELDNGLIKHMGSSPIFMPHNKKTTIEELNKWLEEEDNYAWATFDKEEAVAYIKLTRDGENFITESKAMMNICGAYALEKVRGSGVYQQLITHVLDFLKENGISYCGVDFESLNLAGSSFWLKYFEAYTFSVVRRIDERIYNQ